MRPYDANRRGQRLDVFLTMQGRVARGARRFLRTLPWTLGGLGLLFGIDFIGRYPNPEIPAGIYWASVVGLALFISLVMGITHLFRGERWIFDIAERTVAFESSSPWGSPTGVAVDLSNLRAIEAVLKGLGEESTIELDFGEERETVCSTRLGGDALEPIVGALDAHFDETSVDIRIDRAE